MTSESFLTYHPVAYLTWLTLRLIVDDWARLFVLPGNRNGVNITWTR